MAGVKKQRPKLKKKFIWRLPIVMAERRIYKKSDLHKLLTDVGLEISTVHVGRIFKDMPELLNSDLLLALMQVLDCTLDDLLRVEDVESDGEEIKVIPEKPEKRVVARTEARKEKTEATPTPTKVVKVRGKGGLSVVEQKVVKEEYDINEGPDFEAPRNLRKEALDKEAKERD